MSKGKLYENHGWKQHTNLQEMQIVKVLKFVLNNSYFKFNGSHYHQVSGCAMGSPVSAIIADIVMQEIETIAINTSPVPVRWGRRYVDDSNSCLQRQHVDKFHSHLNSINQNIQFTIEMPSPTEHRQQISFLDTMIIIEKNRIVEIDVCRKSTHTNKYLLFSSHNPIRNRRAVVRSLFDRAKSIPSTILNQRNEQERVMKDLALNGYPSKFIQQTSQLIETHAPSGLNNNTAGFTSLSYVKRLSEQIKRILFNFGVRTAYKPMYSLSDAFGKLKDKQAVSEIKGIVYKFECPDCPFTYIGKSKRSWKPRLAEHKPGVRPEIKSAIKDHAESTGHDASMENATIIEKRIHNTHKRLFLESLH